MVHRLVGAAVDHKPLAVHELTDKNPLMDSSFVVTDGAQIYTITLIEVGNGSQPLLMFLDEIPPRDRARLLAQFPDLEYDPHTYGSYARRNLSATKATIMNHVA